MKKIKLAGGNVHKTYLENNKIVQYLNPDFKVLDKNKVNLIVNILKENNIVAANVIYQDKNKRIFEKLDGEFYEFFTLLQAKKAARFLATLHGVLNSSSIIHSIVKPSNWHMIKEMDLPDEQPIWGDLKANNILWRNNKPVGIVDYDTLCMNDVIFDIANAIVMWQKDFSVRYSQNILNEYNSICSLNDYSRIVPDNVRKFILLLHKKFSQEYLGFGYMKKSKKYMKMRLINLNDKYEKSINWRSI